MTLSFGGGAGVLTIPGLQGDGLQPGGIVVDGAISAGDQSGGAIESLFNLYGGLRVYEQPGNITQGDPIIAVHQGQTLSGDSLIPVVILTREGTLAGNQYTEPILMVEDVSGSTAPLQSWEIGAGRVAVIGQAGGLGLFGHAAPTAPRTLAQATITAITDANAKAAVQACANALADMGVLTLT